MYNSFQVMYTVGYSLSLGALLLALATLLGLRYARPPCPAPLRPHRGKRAGGQAPTRCPRSKLHCTRNYIHANLFASFVLKASSVLVIDTLLKTRYSQKIGDDLSVSVWLSDGVSTQTGPPGLPAPGRQVAAGPELTPPLRPGSGRLPGGRGVHAVRHRGQLLLAAGGGRVPAQPAGPRRLPGEELLRPLPGPRLG